VLSYFGLSQQRCSNMRLRVLESQKREDLVAQPVAAAAGVVLQERPGSRISAKPAFVSVALLFVPNRASFAVVPSNDDVVGGNSPGLGEFLEHLGWYRPPLERSGAYPKTQEQIVVAATTAAHPGVSDLLE